MPNTDITAVINGAETKLAWRRPVTKMRALLYRLGPERFNDCALATVSARWIAADFPSDVEAIDAIADTAGNAGKAI